MCMLTIFVYRRCAVDFLRERHLRLTVIWDVRDEGGMLSVIKQDVAKPKSPHMRITIRTSVIMGPTTQ